MLLARWLLATQLLLGQLVGLAFACGPGRGGGRRPILRKLTPLVFKQHVPNVSENTLPASGLSEGRVSRNDNRFRDLVPNYNADIIFKDEEGTGADRLMTQRCKEKLNTLAISVMNQWPGVKLRVTEGWDEEGKHAQDSLHYEGRAVDVTTSDRDRAKYGMLARLAVEAGFDWVYYESRSHIHCSVKSESSSAGKSGGCFPGSSQVLGYDGRRFRLEELRLGDFVASMDVDSGKILFSEVIAFIDRSPRKRQQFVLLNTRSGRAIRLTPTHLLLVHGRGTVFAAHVHPGDRLLIRLDITSSLGWDEVLESKLILEQGAYAPLTMAGTILVDDVIASCYALVDSQNLAHAAFLPLRIWSGFESTFASLRRHLLLKSSSSRQIVNTIPNTRADNTTQGVHWYASLLYSISTYVLPKSMFYI
ncbi:sonic hedgehog protein [Phymastichus coffea]|uniref:sonic hedgehog protein n=1 Tax=Phymastichus coffea TaxID=108790 RepID=UPI00273CB084|nr:sonic hedgehog protein [Phymastichus coffea]